MITLIDYGLGNLKAFENIYRSLNIPVNIASSVGGLGGAEKLILPGVGAFDWAMTKLNESGMREELTSLVCERNVPILGVCVGMQMLGNSSEEGELEGLGWIDAEVLRLEHDEPSKRLSLPHMGWNGINVLRESPLFSGLLEDAEFYFLHSYFISPKESSSSLATSNYTSEFVSAVNVRNIYGTQFHPEKSHAWGVRLLKNFADIEA